MTQRASDNESTEQDTAAIARLIKTFFGAVSFEQGETAEYSRIRELFIESGQLIRNTTDVPEILSVEEFIRAREAYAITGNLTRFKEVELDHRTETFGRVGHRFSTFRKLGSDSGVDYDVTGRITTQAIYTPNGWRLTVRAWDDERPGLTVPGTPASLA